MSDQIVLNKLRTPDGTVLISYDVHDYKSHTDANGEVYMTDGGNDYLRRSKNKEPFEDLTVYITDEFALVRDSVTWGTFGNPPDYTKGLIYVPVSRLSNDHIENILRTQDHISQWRRYVFSKELMYRKDNKMFIPEGQDYTSVRYISAS